MLGAKSKFVVSGRNGSTAASFSSATCSQCFAEDYSADDSSSLGYGSGHSSTYSDTLEARIDDFYRNSNSGTPTVARRVGNCDDAEFYDLDSVDNFSLGFYRLEDQEEDSAVDHGRQFLTRQHNRIGSLPDFDLVEPSEVLRRSFSTKLHISNSSSRRGHVADTVWSKLDENRLAKSCDQNLGEEANCSETGASLSCIPEEHIYEEVRYDTTDLNLEGVRPPPLPKRTYCYTRPSVMRRRAVSTSGIGGSKISGQGIQNFKI